MPYVLSHVPLEELGKISKLMLDFTSVWSSMRPPWPHTFDGTYDDIRCMDYMQYEGIKFPPCGYDGDALVCGEVFRRAADLHWFQSPSGDWYIATENGDFPGFSICPVVRINELRYAGTPQFGWYSTFITHAALAYFPFCSGSPKKNLAAILKHNVEEVTRMEATFKKLGKL